MGNLMCVKHVDRKNVSGETALMRASYKRRFEKVKKLIEKGADVNAFNNYNTTVLMFAYGDHAILKFLLNHGVSLDNILLRNYEGDTMLDIAEKLRDYKTLIVLRTFIERNIDTLEATVETAKIALSDYFSTDGDLIDFYIQKHKFFTDCTTDKNLSNLIKKSPSFGHTFTFYSSNRYTLIDDVMLKILIDGQSIEYPRILKCTWFKPILSTSSNGHLNELVFLVLTTNHEFLFANDYTVFITPRFMKVEKIIRRNYYTVIYIAC